MFARSVNRWSALATAVLFLGDQFSMPGQQRLGRNDGGDIRQKLPSQPFLRG